MASTEGTVDDQASPTGKNQRALAVTVDVLAPTVEVVVAHEEESQRKNESDDE